MSVPKQRHTKQRRDAKRDRFKIKTVKTVTCPKCGKQKLQHKACPHCGFYKGKEVINTLKKKVGKKKK
ncbi:MAG TPA: 50S ribosomal protein L32 [Candidatus Moranbacteria bacterium]|nr:50S ribosomal protein L32 [Candidatus Moranbacteria bacterium]